MDAVTDRRMDRLRKTLLELRSVAVAYSGGVDSTLLAVVAHDVLGDDMLAITSAGRVMPSRDLERTRAFCAKRGMRHVEVPFDELQVPGFAANPPDRCYLCKRQLFLRMAQIAAEHGARVLVDGSNKDDEGDYRPGMRALEELGIRSPLREAGLTKAQVRQASREMGLATWDMPSAACLASRIAYGDVIDESKLRRVEAAEEFLHELGFRQLRARVHGARGEVARIEVPADEIRLVAEDDVRATVAQRLRSLGFTYVSLDLTGFRSGSMNDVLT